MRHGVDGRQFGRNTSHRKAMFKNLANNLITQEQIITTVAKAKETRRVVDRLITLGKSDNVHSRRIAFARTRNNRVVKKLFSTLADRYKTRKGGYTRILKISNRRRGDGAEMAVLELVDRPELKRKKIKPVVPEGQQAADQKDGAAPAGASQLPANDADPFGKFRKLFGGTRKKSKAAAKAAASSTDDKKTKSKPKKEKAAKEKK